MKKQQQQQQQKLWLSGPFTGMFICARPWLHEYIFFK